MSDKPWIEAIAEDDLDIYSLAGFGNSVGFGQRPAILVIDVQYRTAGTEPTDIHSAITTMYPTACGHAAWDAIAQLEPLLDAAHRCGAPVIYPFVAPKKAIDAGAFGRINPDITSIDNRGYEFVAEIAPRDDDVILPKRHASAFFGTALTSYLVDFGIDTVIVTGATTSGCVRATVADAFSYNYRTIVPYECVFDRIQTSHAVSLFDMDAKYADVVPSSCVIEYLQGL